MSERWKVWDEAREYGELLERRAQGIEPEMASARAVTAHLTPLARPKDRILDVGCGAGHYLPSLRRALGADFSYLGVDATRDFLARAAKVFAADPRAAFARGDARRLPLADRSVDLALCSNLLLHLPALAAPLRELARVVRRGLVVRTLVADKSFLVQEVRPRPDGAAGGDPEFDENGLPRSYCYYNIYSRAHVERVLAGCPGVEEVSFHPDQAFETREIEAHHLGARGDACFTSIRGGNQTLGPLSLPWTLIVALKGPTP